MIEQGETNILTIPHSRAAEEALLGALLIDPECLRKLTVQPEDFYIIKHAWIYSAMQELTRRGEAVDYLTVCTCLDSQKRLGEIGGPAYVMGLINATPSSLSAESYAHTVQERAKRREVIQLAQRLATAGFDLDSDLNGAVSAALDSLARSVVSDKGAVHISKFVSQIYEEVDAAQRNPQDIYGIPTGFIDWDRITFGLQLGEKITLSGMPGVGKSVLGCQVLINAAKCGYPGALYELEMSGRQVVRRALANKTREVMHDKGGVTTQRMRQGKLTEEEIPVFTHAVEIMSDLPIYISDASEMTTVELRADLMRLKDYFGVKVVMVDYEGLLGDAPDKDDNTRSKLISKRMHDVAKDLNLAVLSISDMTKDGINGVTKGQGSVAGTARSLHDADQIIVIRKTENGNLVRLTWEKFREGDSDRFIDLVKDAGFPAFKNAVAPAARK